MVNWGSPESVGQQNDYRMARRTMLGGLVVVGGLALTGMLSGCATMGLPGSSPADAEPVRRLMRYSSERAFTWLVQPDGFWTSPVARIPLPVLFTRTGSTKSAVLKSPKFREQLQHQLNTIASQSAGAAASVVSQTAKDMAIPNAAGVLRGGRTEATTLLRKAVGPGVVNAMMPGIERAMQQTTDPTLGQAIAALKGVTITDAAHALAIEADNSIWYEIGSAEAAIRQDPAQTNDAVLIGALKGG
ncbi:uncharacterized protein DUF4197 [Novosphingobium sp. PhB165]|uniref:DUF4197 family protein n=1 Tax=Novosphingobium sp. PhB165 TaxID=2485105 RepID=UPI0010E9CE17|nr:DUF4197 family protein [Novosphingobium sp. PhB165]TCM21912.1 uncharacterized protein DUF4197 [Novosphingobium sp. PhB165]